ncbi:class F sortase [Nonomuraea typhae]|uniref:Class F sortase n=1 Tax=Nonomuraea typhae TaxID=2603600 RepID=A0ABW7Z157_9ACTN
MSERKNPMNRTLPGLLVAGSLAGVAAVTLGVLQLAPTLAAPSTSGGTLAAATDPREAEQQAPVEIQHAGAFELPPTVGPGGKNVPLTPAKLDAPPPLAALPPIAPIPTAKTPSKKAKPERIRIPKIKVSAPIGAVTLDANGNLGVPALSKPNLTGWYRHSPVPGELGPAVINGHVNTRKGPAVFNRLAELAKGDSIYVYRTDGKVTRFTVSGIEQVSKNAFPTARVYGNTTDAQLRLVTCGGVYNKAAHSYADNVIVYATLSKKKG